MLSAGSKNGKVVEVLPCCVMSLSVECTRHTITFIKMCMHEFTHS
jgi:hypothetical protein